MGVPSPLQRLLQTLLKRIRISLPNAGDPFNACISSTVKYRVVEYEVGRISTIQLQVREPVCQS